VGSERDPLGFPIQGEYRYDVSGDSRRMLPELRIPWTVAEIAYAEYAEQFGRHQSLDRLAERGGFGRDELLTLLAHAAQRAVHGRPAHPWVYCADAEPDIDGVYTVAIQGTRSQVVLPFVGYIDSLWCVDGGLGVVYAWCPAAKAPPLRPADRSYLLTQGVPAEWLGAPEED